MAATKITCDDCGKETDQFYSSEYCIPCEMAITAKAARREYEKYKVWVQSTWIDKLERKRIEVEELEEKAKSLREATEI
jgi:hypothetical protein